MACNRGLYCCARMPYGGWYPCEQPQVMAPISQVLQPTPAVPRTKGGDEMQVLTVQGYPDQAFETTRTAGCGHCGGQMYRTGMGTGTNVSAILWGPWRCSYCGREEIKEGT
jgi:hypothetical protein